MEWETWRRLYGRLCAAKDHAVNGEQCAAYFDALKSYPDLCVEQAVFRATREVTGWPKSDAMVALAREERQKLSTSAEEHKCPECHGQIWVPGPPRYDFGNTYETVMKCPTCRPQARKAEVA